MSGMESAANGPPGFALPDPPHPYCSRWCRYSSGLATYGHFTTGGMEDRMEFTLPPVFSPKVVPRS